jgi:hypothetical protein
VCLGFFKNILDSIFPNKIHFENKKVRTVVANLILNEIASINNAYGRIKNGTRIKNRLVP